MNFAILKLMKADFIDYYKIRNQPDPDDNFRKLTFVFNLDTDDDPNVSLLCFALKGKREIMNPSGIALRDTGQKITKDAPFNLGTIEIPYNVLKTIIGTFDHIEPTFRFLRFEANIDSSFIGYDVYFNSSSALATHIKGNPCPPAKQD